MVMKIFGDMWSVTAGSYGKVGLANQRLNVEAQVRRKPSCSWHRSSRAQTAASEADELRPDRSWSLNIPWSLGPRLRFIRSPVHLWDARARAPRQDETPWTSKVVHPMGVECFGACRSKVGFCLFFCQAWAPNAEYGWKQLITFWETGEHFKQHRIERYLSCSPVRSIFCLCNSCHISKNDCEFLEHAKRTNPQKSQCVSSAWAAAQDFP